MEQHDFDKPKESSLADYFLQPFTSNFGLEDEYNPSPRKYRFSELESVRTNDPRYAMINMNKTDNKIPFADIDEDDMETTPRFSISSVLEELFGSVIECEGTEEKYMQVLSRIGTTEERLV